MATRNARVKGHTRTSKNGKVHKVKAHGRSVELGEMLRQSFRNKSARKALATTAASGVFTGMVYTLSSMAPIAASIMWAVGISCFAVITFMLMTKGQRRAKRRKIRKSAALSMERRLKLWTHHRVTAFRRPKPAGRVQ